MKIHAFVTSNVHECDWSASLSGHFNPRGKNVYFQLDSRLNWARDVLAMRTKEYLAPNMKQDRQCTYNVTLGRVHITIVAVESSKYYILVCVCILARVCVHVGTRSRGRVHAHTCI